MTRIYAAEEIALLKGEELAQAYAFHVSRTMRSPCYAEYGKGGWITVGGHIKRCHPDVSDLYGKGWSMRDTIRSTEARRKMVEQAIPEWVNFDAMNADGRIVYFEFQPQYCFESGVWHTNTEKERHLETNRCWAPPQEPWNSLFRWDHALAGDIRIKSVACLGLTPSFGLLTQN